MISRTASSYHLLTLVPNMSPALTNRIALDYSISLDDLLHSVQMTFMCQITFLIHLAKFHQIIPLISLRKRL